MACIKVAKYQTIAQLYANAQAQVQGVADYYYDAAYEIVILTVFDPELDLLAPFYNAYQSAQNLYLQAPAAIVSAVGALQRHVLDKARTDSGVDADTSAPRRFTDINDWLNCANEGDGNSFGAAVGRTNDVDTSEDVPQLFAVLSARAGFDIDEDNIS